jgi:acyl-CoA synthetase (AMP-forming)/AMP-acid ligase II
VSRALTSTCQYLANHARQRPNAIAVDHGGLRVTYRSLAAHVLDVIDELSGLGLGRGQVAGVVVGERYLHLLILLAAETLGVTTISLAATELGLPAKLGRLCDRIIVVQPPAVACSDKILTMPNDWLATILSRPPRDRGLEALEPEPEPDFRVRLIKSSGTTGVPKVMGMTHRVQQGVIEKILLHAPPWVLSHPDFLCLYNFAVRAAHVRMLLTLQLGGTVHLTGANVIWDRLMAGIGNYALFVAGDLERFVRTAPHGDVPSALYLEVIGAAVPPQLRREARARLTQHIMVTYSSNETNRVAIIDDDNVGTLFADVRVRIVGPQGETVPFGRPGSIHVRTGTMTDGYIDAPELTRAAFVDGWFRTGDIGFQPSADRLVVLGRDDDMLNIGGLKIAPGPIERHLRAIEGVGDALVTSIDDQLLTRVMLVAVELAPNADPAELTRRISPILQTQVPHFQLVVLPALPRTETGKIRRDAVAELYRRQAQSLLGGKPG